MSDLHLLMCLLVLISCIPQLVLSLKLGHDTLKTITANETYKFGYRTSKFQTGTSHFYSASSGFGLSRLAKKETKIYNAAVKISSTLQTSQQTRLEETINGYLKDYEEISSVLMKEATFNGNASEASIIVAGDLIGAYRMVRRFRNYIQRGLCKALAILAPTYSNDSEVISNLNPPGGKGPFKRDIHLTMFAIIFTQLQYGWSPYSVSMGTVKGMELGKTLGAVHSIELGVHAVASGVYSVGIDWLELAVIKIQNGDQSADLNLAVDLLEKAKAKHDKLWHPLTFWSLNATFFTKRLNDTSKIESRRWQRSIVVDPLDEVQLKLVGDRSWDMCAGQLEQTEETKSDLFCWHETMVDPSWKIGPLKVELLAKFPYQVVQFHNVLGVGITQHILTSCDIRLNLADLLVTQKQFNPKLRLCEYCVGSYDQLYKLTRRITGHATAGIIKTLVSIYPPGGHTRLHVDNNGQDYKGRSLATMTYFLEEPEIGGELVFQNAGATAKPIKGSAIFWYNLFKSAELDYSTTHASCSTVKGKKIIATHGISYRLQPHLTCDKDRRTKEKYLCNGKS